MTTMFDATRCADETASKPDPRMLVEILEALAVFPGEAVMIGDTTFDLEMAARAQVRSIGLAHGAHEADAASAIDEGEAAPREPLAEGAGAVQVGRVVPGAGAAEHGDGADGSGHHAA